MYTRMMKTARQDRHGGITFFMCNCDTQVPRSTSSNCRLSYQIGGMAYVAFTRVVALSAKVEFWPSSRSGGRAGLPDIAIVTPTGRAFNPVAVSPRFFRTTSGQCPFTADVVVILSLFPASSTADLGLMAKSSPAAGAWVERRIDADVEESVHCCTDLAPVERDGCRGCDSELTRT